MQRRELNQWLAQLEDGSGDITQKGYEKKRSKLLAPYLPGQSESPPVPLPRQSRQHKSSSGEGAASPSSRARRRAQRRVTRNESRYHSEVRQEAVQQAIAAMQSRPKQLPMPSKRQSVMARSPEA
ncbi:disco-interacting protein 2 homolog B-like, partial [Pollicipes pollicipes]|uniref:disco-interacting protein 2 homolog B-like n=1 Tax=Pollicipes pollicipes TaxID=41117 RepID=UPI001884F5D6